MRRRTFLSTAGKSLALAAAANRTLPALAEPPSQTFPPGFAWGAATSAMQVEGYPYADGGGRSIWSVLDHEPSKVKDGSNNLIADDTYHRGLEDIPLMRAMGLNSYRLSIGWPRVLPEGRGKPNKNGLDYYDRLLDGLLRAGITPWVTVFHFDYPQALEQVGGWLNPDSPQWLADYAHLLAGRYGDRVKHWLTINEPNIFWSLGAEAGMFPPFRKFSQPELAAGVQNILLGHGRSVAAIRAAAKGPVHIGLPFAGMVSLPATESPADIAAAREAGFAVEPRALIPSAPPLTVINMALWLDPIYLGRYPEAALRALPTLEKLQSPAALKEIAQPLDFCAVNLYFAPRVKAGPGGKPEPVPDPPGTKHTAYGWAITPELLYWGPRFLHERYGKPIVITENGMSNHDKPGPDGHIHDPGRSEFIKSYLRQYLRAHREGIPLGGYFHWSLLDNWEFTQGFTQQFGLIYVDRPSLKRIPKDSAQTYAAIIRSRGASLG